MTSRQRKLHVRREQECKQPRRAVLSVAGRRSHVHCVRPPGGRCAFSDAVLSSEQNPSPLAAHTYQRDLEPGKNAGFLISTCSRKWTEQGRRDQRCVPAFNKALLLNRPLFLLKDKRRSIFFMLCILVIKTALRVCCCFFLISQINHKNMWVYKPAM